ncbi:MAG: nucleoside-triphosphatase [Kiritimatiellia bacterium]
MKNNRIILTGEKQTGKSTACRRLLDTLAPKSLFGFRTFRTPEGFALSAWNGRSVPFAFWKSAGREYEDLQIDLSVFNSTGTETLIPPSPAAWLAMDELGIMEQRARDFASAVRTAWASPNPGIAVIQKRALDFWLNELKENPCPVYEITPVNRDAAPEALAGMLASETVPAVAAFVFLQIG